MNYRVRAVRVKQHDGGGARTVRSERSRFGLGPRTERVGRTLLFRWTKADGWETVGHESSGTEDTCGIGCDAPIRIHHPSSCIIADIRASLLLGNFDDDGLSARVYIDKGPITRPLPQIEDLLPSNGNCIE